MSRLNLTEEKDYETTGGLTLEELIPSYYLNKRELDSYKKICDTSNAKIKDLMLAANENEHQVGDLVAKRTVVTKESMSEDKLMAVLHKYNIDGIIKTREYVDMDALESYMYNNELSPEIASDLASCVTTTEVVQLRVTRKKSKKESD
jgi:hypothetical protein